jgi:hypothetical protein
MKKGFIIPNSIFAQKNGRLNYDFSDIRNQMWFRKMWGQVYQETLTLNDDAQCHRPKCRALVLNLVMKNWENIGWRDIKFGVVSIQSEKKSCFPMLRT